MESNINFNAIYVDLIFTCLCISIICNYMQLYVTEREREREKEREREREGVQPCYPICSIVGALD